MSDGVKIILSTIVAIIVVLLSATIPLGMYYAFIKSPYIALYVTIGISFVVLVSIVASFIYREF